MKYRILGRTNLSESEIGLGALEIGRDYWRKGEKDFSRPDEREAIALEQKAIDLGINFIDTVPAFFPCEELVGKALKGKRCWSWIVTSVRRSTLQSFRHPTMIGSD